MNNGSSLSSGAFNIASGASLSLTGSYAHNLSGNITGSGTIEIFGSVNVSGAFTFGGTTNISNGTLNLSTDTTTATLEILNLPSGTLTGPGDLTADTINWSGGMMSGSGTTTASSVVNFTGPDNIYLYERIFNNAGVASWDKAGYCNIQTSAVINNQAGATFSV